MSIKEHTCYTVVCDVCGKDIEVDNDGITMHFDDPDEARNELETNEDGVAVAEGDLCRTCKDLPHEYRPHEVFADACARCGAHIDEHDIAPVAAALDPTPIPDGEE